VRKKRTPPKYLYKYFPDHNTFAADVKLKCQAALNRPYLYCSSVDLFNDPFELQLMIETPKGNNDWLHLRQLFIDEGRPMPSEEAWLEHIKINRAEAERRFEEQAFHIKSETRLQARICCFSEIHDSILMWSHYATKHAGYCLKINVEKAGLKDHLIPVLYSNGNDFPKFRVQDIKLEDYRLTFGHKHNGWKYEKEWRFICSGTDMEYPAEAVESVYYGAESEEPLKSELRAAFPEATFMQSKVAQSSYRLLFSPTE
jgi:hypothetical protein